MTGRKRLIAALCAIMVLNQGLSGWIPVCATETTDVADENQDGVIDEITQEKDDKTDDADNFSNDGTDTEDQSEENTSMEDVIAPKVTISYQAVGQNPLTGEDTSLVAQVLKDKDTIERTDMEEADENTRFIYNGAVMATILVEEENFREEDISVSIKKDGVELSEEEKEAYEIVWHEEDETTSEVEEGEEKDATYELKENEENEKTSELEEDETDEKTSESEENETEQNASDTEHEKKEYCEITFNEDGDYELMITYTDPSGNPMEYVSDEYPKKCGTTTYTSNIFTIDTTQPVITVDYQETSSTYESYFSKPQCANVKITDRNFRPNEVVVSVMARDTQGNVVGVPNSNLCSWSNWIQDPDDADTWCAQIDFVTDGAYTFELSYVDLAGNKAVESVTDTFVVDTISPCIEVFYSSPRQMVGENEILYYDADMTVTFVITEANFFPEDVRISVNGTSEVLKNWTKEQNQWSGILTLSGEGKYQITVEYEDRSMNKMQSWQSGQIVIDRTAPVLDVSYNTPVSKRDDISYYAQPVETTLVISEANFYPEEVEITVSKDDASPVAMETTWQEKGEDHVGTFSLAEEGTYVISVRYADRSGHQIEPYVSKQLVVDRTSPTIRVSDLLANSATKEKKIGFTITASDNLDNLDAAAFVPHLTAVTRSEQGIYEEKEIRLNNWQVVEENRKYQVVVDNLEEDAVYKLSASAADRAGNENHMLLLDDGKESETVRFSVNRNGSIFLLDETTMQMMEQYYVYRVEQDVVIDEINVDPVETYRIKLNNQVLQEGIDYTTRLSGDEEAWSRRTYQISKKLFYEEGEYNIVVESVDKTNSRAYSDVKYLKIAWVVDRTAPTVTLSGLMSGGKYDTSSQLVTAIPGDDGGKLYRFTAVVLSKSGEPLLDENGAHISQRINLSGTKLTDYLEKQDGKITFTIPQGEDYQVRIICQDYVVDADGTRPNTYDQTFSDITVSPQKTKFFYKGKNKFPIAADVSEAGIYAQNTSVMAVSIVAVSAVIGGILILTAAGKRRKK